MHAFGDPLKYLAFGQVNELDLWIEADFYFPLRKVFKTGESEMAMFDLFDSGIILMI